MESDPGQHDAVTEAQMERFRSLCWPLLPTILRTAQFLTRHEADAEDLVQEAMLKALRAMDSFRDGTNVKAWLMTILRRTQIDRVRAEQRRGPMVSLEAEFIDEPASPDQPGSPELADRWEQPEDLLEQFQDQQIISALKALPEAIRWTLLLVDVEGVDHEEAAEVLGVPVGTIKSRAFRGRRMLCASLEQTSEPEGPDESRLKSVCEDDEGSQNAGDNR